MKIIAFLFMVSVSTAGFAMDCSYQSKSSEAENIKIFFYGSSNEMAKIEYPGSDPDRYFILSSIKNDGLEGEYSEFAIRSGAKSALTLVNKTGTRIFVSHLKGGNHYKLKLGERLVQLTCRK